MNTFLTEVRQMLVPHGEGKYGPLPPLLVAMTLVTGLVDAFSYLVLGHVFVANMTGNVVFLAFALAGAAQQTLLFGASTVLAALSGSRMSAGYSYSLIVMLGIAMGLQNATARKLAVPDLTTTVLTLTIVGLAVDSRIVGGSGSRAGRRLIAVVAMLLGALVGGLLVIHLSIVYPLVIALIVTATIAVTMRALSSTDLDWAGAS